MEKLCQADITAALEALPGWTFEENQLRRAYEFADFTWAFGFMATAAPAIEKLNHHPQWTNVYNKVTVLLSTHDVGGVTNKDFELARILEKIADRLLVPGN
jgi:4a-hydroxytetrahydrobiopterin dehydratase